MVIKFIKILFMMPIFYPATEVWHWRMISLLENHLKKIVVKDLAGATRWSNGVPVLSLRSQPAEIHSLSQLLKRFGLDLSTSSRSGKTEILREIVHLKVDKILCQYGTFAVQNSELLQESGLPIYKHFNGYNAFFHIWQAKKISW